MWIAILILTIFALFLFFVFALRGRVEQGRFDGIKGYAIAHRGLHDKPQVPENSMAAFSHAVEKGYGIELDLHLTADGKLAVFHDNTLERTSNGEGKVKEHTLEELKKLHLEGTDQQIPHFEQVLELVQGRVPLIIELKAEGNSAELCQATLNALQDYDGYFCIESFDPRPLLWLKRNRPEITRGQLSQNFLKHSEGLPFVLKILLTSLMLNFITKPDFVAYNHLHRGDLPNHLCKNLWKMQGVAWTVTSSEDKVALDKEGYISIFEGFEPK